MVLFFFSFPLLRCGWSCSQEAFPHKNKIKFLVYDYFVEKPTTRRKTREENDSSRFP